MSSSTHIFVPHARNNKFTNFGLDISYNGNSTLTVAKSRERFFDVLESPTGYTWPSPAYPVLLDAHANATVVLDKLLKVGF